MASIKEYDGELRELALFAGAGGGILGGKLLGWRTVCAVEIEPYPASVLCQRQNDGLLPPFPIWDDVRTFDGKPWRGIVDVISGGFPCQDISAAGRGAGIEGERSGLWKEYARIIGEVRPRFVLVENSPMLTCRGLGTVLGDLASLGYDARWGIISAADAGAPHLRERIWVLAYPSENERIHRIFARNLAEKRGWGKQAKRGEDWNGFKMGQAYTPISLEKQAYKPDNCGMADRESPWVDELAAIGNQQVPAVVRLAWECLS